MRFKDDVAYDPCAALLHELDGSARGMSGGMSLDDLGQPLRRVRMNEPYQRVSKVFDRNVHFEHRDDLPFVGQPSRAPANSTEPVDERIEKNTADLPESLVPRVTRLASRGRFSG